MRTMPVGLVCFCIIKYYSTAYLDFLFFQWLYKKDFSEFIIETNFVMNIAIFRYIPYISLQIHYIPSITFQILRSIHFAQSTSHSIHYIPNIMFHTLSSNIWKVMNGMKCFKYISFHSLLSKYYYVPNIKLYILDNQPSAAFTGILSIQV